MILRGSLLTQGVTSSSRAWTPWVSSETLMILNLRGSAVFTLWSNLELGQRKNELLASHYIKLVFKLSGKLEISSYFDQLSANIGKGWSTSSATRKNTWNQFRHTFCLMNIQVCTGCEQLFTENHLKPISPCFLSSEDKKHGENAFKCSLCGKLFRSSTNLNIFKQKAWRNWFQVFSVWINVQI